mgnify:FL=1
MKQLFLTSASDFVIEDIVKKLPSELVGANLAFINTASEVEEGNHWWVKAEKDGLLKVGFSVDEFSITGMSKEEIEKKLKNNQIIYFCGGNTFYLLDQVIKTGCDQVIRDSLESGVIYVGSSAGSMIVGKRIDLVSTIDDPTKASELKSTGLEIVDFAILPHWGSNEFKEGYSSGFENMYTEALRIVPITNQQYLWVRDDRVDFIQI